MEYARERRKLPFKAIFGALCTIGAETLFSTPFVSYKINLSIIEKRKSLMTRMEERAASMKSEKSNKKVSLSAENLPRLDERSMLTV